jgi:hypothetical protein
MRRKPNERLVRSNAAFWQCDWQRFGVGSRWAFTHQRNGSSKSVYVGLKISIHFLPHL